MRAISRPSAGRGRDTIGPGGVSAADGGGRFSGAAGAMGRLGAASAGAGGAGPGPTNVEPSGEARRRAGVGAAAVLDSEKPPAHVLCPTPLAGPVEATDGGAGGGVGGPGSGGADVAATGGGVGG